MKYEERKQDLFTVGDDYYLAHCISADFAMGKGIAVEFRRRGVKRQLHDLFYDYVNEYHRHKTNGDCILTTSPNVFNLITKERYFEKPTYESLENALLSMKRYCAVREIDKIAMPKIGCGLDGLYWRTVSRMIQDIFEDTDVEIVVCCLEE